MRKNPFRVMVLLLGAVISLKANGQGINLADWTALSEENSKAALTDTIFQGKPCIKLDGKTIAAIWNKQANLKNFRLERVEAGTYRIKLPLQKGNNELIFITQGDGFFFGKGYNSLGRLQHQNWGFIAGIGD